MRTLALWLALCCLALAGRAAAKTLQISPSVTVSQAYDSNVRPYAGSKESSLSTIVAPKLGLVFRGDRTSGSAAFDGRANRHWDESDLDAFDRSLSFDVEHMLAPRFSLSSAGRYDYMENTDDFQMGPDVIAGRPDTEYLSWTGSGRYSLTGRTVAFATPYLSFTDVSDQELPFCEADGELLRVPPPCPSEERRFDAAGNLMRIPVSQSVQQASETRVFGGRLGLERSLSVRDSASLGFGFSQRNFKRGTTTADSARDTSDDVASVSANWAHNWTPRWLTRLTLGAERIKSDTEPIDVADLGLEPYGSTSTLAAFDDESLIATGGLALEFRDRRTAFSLSYMRESNPSVSYGTSLDTQTMRAALSRRLNSRFTVDIGGYWSREKSLGDVISVLGIEPGAETSRPDPDPDAFPGTTLIESRAVCPPSSVEFVSAEESVPGIHVVQTGCLGFTDRSVSQDSLYISAGVNWRMSKRFSTFLRYGWFQRSSAGDSRVLDYDRNTFTLGFTYGYDIDLY